MVHISDLSWTRKHSHPGEALQKGQDVKCVVLEVNVDKRRVSLGIKQITEDPWIRAIPEKYIPGHIIKGKVAKLTNFGAFVELEPDLEGLLHISELADHKIDKPQDIVKVGDEVEVKILKVDTDARKIGLSLRRVQWAAEEEAAESDKQQRAPSGPERVLSDADMNKFVKPKTVQLIETDAPVSNEDKTDAKADDSGSEIAAPAGPDSVLPDADVSQLIKPQEEKADQPEVVDTEPADTDKKEADETDEAEEVSEVKEPKSSILNVFKRKRKAKAKEETEQPPENTDASAQAGDDSSPEEKTEQE
jgi:predicted RNA-binding protein with RPS1 domain